MPNFVEKRKPKDVGPTAAKRYHQYRFSFCKEERGSMRPDLGEMRAGHQCDSGICEDFLQPLIKLNRVLAGHRAQIIQRLFHPVGIKRSAFHSAGTGSIHGPQF